MPHSPMAHANAGRHWQFCQKVFEGPYAQVGARAAPPRRFRFKNKLVNLDASAIDLRLLSLGLGEVPPHQGAVKLRVLLDHDGYLPCFAVITNGEGLNLLLAARSPYPALVTSMLKQYKNLQFAACLNTLNR
ncbi:MAG: hypothetical protein M0Z84_05080, partial [Gammaproteobacteria bacterium]|nr:hypothetical protein [Gammaproteobacteria bacterium]